jgi:predicted dehydrogenase
VTPSKLVTHRFDFADALKAYDLLDDKSSEYYLGIVLKYAQAQGSEKAFKAAPKPERVVQRNSSCGGADSACCSGSAVGVGFVGAGNFAKAVLLPALKKTAGIDCVGVCTATGVSAHAAAAKFGFRVLSTDYDELLAHKDVKAVFVTTRHSVHAAQVIKGLKSGRHVFVEKPLCISSEELTEICDCYNSLEKPPILQVGFNRRFAPMLQNMKELVAGKPMSAVYRINAGVIPLNTWVQDPALGGGRIVGEVCHFVDALLYLAGSQPVMVFADCVRKADRSIPDEDNLSLQIRFANGSTATVHYFAYGSKAMEKEYLELYAPNTAMKMTNFKTLEIFSGNNHKKIKSWSQQKGFTEELSAFVKAIKTGIPAIPFVDMVKVTKVCFAALESLRSGLPVRIE